MIQETSMENYLDIIGSGRINEMQEVIFKAFLIHPLSTDREISEISGEEINVVTARRNELVAEGLIEEVGKRACKVTGRTAIYWRICNKAPHSEENVVTCLTDRQLENVGKSLKLLKDHGNDFQKNQIKKWVNECL